MIPLAWLDEVQEVVFEIALPCLHAPAAAWFTCWVACRLALTNA
jgi:hypothetical protein